MQQDDGARDLQAVARLGRALPAILAAPADDLATVLVDEAVLASRAGRGVLYDVQGEKLRVLAINPPSAEPAVGQIVSTSEAGLADTVETAQPRLLTGAGQRSICAPVVVDGAVLHVLVLHPRSTPFERADLEAVSALCHAAAARHSHAEQLEADDRRLRRLERRLALVEGDPSRGRRQGDALVRSLTDDRPGLDIRDGMVNSAPFGVLLLERTPGMSGPAAWTVTSVNQAFAGMRGRRTGDLIGPLTASLGLPTGEAEVDPAVVAVGAQPISRRLQRRDGTVFEVMVYASELADGFALYVADMDTQSRRLRELERMAMTDPVTGLANRTRVTEVLEKCLHNDPPGTVAVMLLDLDRFKNVNDSLGHHVGDLLLIEVTQRLRSSVPAGTVVARLGGDEFLLVLRGLEDTLDVHPLAYGLLETLGEPYDLPSGHRVASSVSIGISIADRPRARAIDLIREADLAMYRAKDLGRNRYALCDETMLDAAENRLSREIVLRRGLENHRLRLRLQPIIDLATGKLAEFEALVRLHDPDRGEVPPIEFVPIAEETGLIAQIDFWVIEETLSLIGSEPRLAADSSVRVAVNVSGRTLERPDFMSRLVVALQQNQVEANRLVVEITESCLLGDNRAILWTLNQLRARGAHVAIDDFGTGYSALSYLQSFEVDLLKIDQSFIARVMHSDIRGTKLVANIVRLAHDLGLRVVAEGVEESEQAVLLQGLGCDLAQGWLYGRPEPPRGPAAERLT